MSPSGGFGQSDSVAGLWLKVDATNFIGGVYQVSLASTVVSYFYGAATVSLDITYSTDAIAKAKFDQVQMMLGRLGAFVDLS
jgi:hypothetical protein